MKIFDHREENKRKAAEALDRLIKRCQSCKRPSSKTRLYKLSDGLTCQACLPDGISIHEILDAEAAHLQHLEAEANKPPPKEFGEWS